MSIALVLFGWILLDTTPIAVLLPVCIGVLGCLCPNSSKVFLMGTASLALKYIPPSSASAADDITALIIFATVCTAPLLGGTVFRKIVCNYRMRRLLYQRNRYCRTLVFKPLLCINVGRFGRN